MENMTIEEKQGVARVLRATEKFVFADGKVDIAEARSLIGLIGPYERKDVDLALFKHLLVDVAEDGIVTDGESREIAAVLSRLVEKFGAVSEGLYDARTLGYPKMGLLGVQHLFAMFGATVLVPLITGMNIQTTLLFAGFGTLLFHLITKWNVPAFLGSSFAFLAGYGAVAPKLDQVLADGTVAKGVLPNLEMLPYACVGVAASALAYFVVSAIVKSAGVKRVMKFFPPVVTGPIVIAIGLVLAPVAVGSASTCWPVALAGILAVLISACFGKGMIRIVPILIGVVVSYAAALILGNGLGVQGAAVNFKEVHEAAWIGFPVVWSQTVFPVLAHPDWGKIISACTIIMPLAAATLMEHVGDVSAISSTINRNLFEKPGLHRTLLGDGLATFVAAVFGAPANTTYGENTGVLSLSKVYDARVIRIAAVLAILLSFCPKFAAVVHTLPGATVGGVSFVLYGMISSVGVRNLVEHQVDFSKARNMLICAITIVCALGITQGIGFTVGSVHFTLSGLAVGALTGILLNAILPGKDYAFDEANDSVKNLKKPNSDNGIHD